MFSLLDITDTPKRRQSYLMSRLALIECIKERKVYLSLDNTLLIDNSQVHGQDHLTVSLSHTKDVAVAISSLKRDVLAVGVDIENSDRTIKDGADKYFCNDKDAFKYSMLQKWIIKEACYKAFSNLTKEEFLLKDVICNQESAIYNGITCYYELIIDDSHTTAVAYVPNI
jgi:phosphopantetheinyl transferase (holo-ACP synthase)